MVKKKFKLAVALFFAGFSVGNTIGYIVNLIISYCIGNGRFLPVMPQLSRFFQYEVNAVTIQSLLFGLIGVVFAEASFLFEIERWSFLKQCIVHFFVTSLFYTPFILLCYMPDKVSSFLIMLGNIVFTYSLTWFLRFRHDKHSVDQINQKIEEARRYDGNQNRGTDKEI